MTPQLPADDLKLIEEFRFKMMELLKESETNFAHWRIEPYKLWDLIQIISRLQSVLDKCVEQRDLAMADVAWYEGSPTYDTLNENQELQKILEGEK